MKRPSWLRRSKVPDVQTRQNSYYENISARLGIVQVVLYLTLFAFVILSFARNTNLITYRNFYYFFKDLDASAEGVDVLHSDQVTYPTSNDQSFVLYRGGLAVAGNNSVTVFTSTGRQTVSQTVSYQNPVAEGAGKYLLVYELGGTQYSLYNSYTQIYSGKTEFPINGAAVSKSGMYALLSSSKEYPSVISLYSSGFSLLNRYHKNGFVMDLSVNDKGNRLCLLLTEARDGEYRSTLELYAPGETEVRATVELQHSPGLSCVFTEDRTVAVLSGSDITFYNTDGELQNGYDFEGMTPASVDLGTSGAAVALQPKAISEKNRIIVFDKSGKMLYNKDADEKIEEISLAEGALYGKTLTGIVRIDLSDEIISLLECHTEQRNILAVNAGEVLLCSPQKAEYLRFASE